jgi:chromosome partitioning protein
MGRVIAIANQKGGVGKTTTAINLGASLAVAEKRTLIVDSDPQSNATSGLGIRQDPELPDVYDCLVNDVPVEEALRQSVHFPMLDVVPASRDLAGAEIELIERPNRERVLRTVLEPIRDQYDYILIDSPPSLGLLTLNALVASDSVLIPIQCEFYALEGLSQLLNTVRIVQRNLNRELGIEGVLLTMFDSRLNLSKQVKSEAEEYFGAKVFRTAIPRNVRLAEAPSFGQPIALYDVLSTGARGYLSLASEIVRRDTRKRRAGSKNRLGRGLGALLGDMIEEQSEGELPVREINLQRVRPNPFQPRRDFDSEALAELQASIRENGLLQPLVVRVAANGFELVAGERRLRALTGLKRDTAPAIVRELSDEQMLLLALVENLQREELNAIEEAIAYQQLIDGFGLTQSQVASRVGRNRSTVANSLRLLTLPQEVQDMVGSGTLSAGHARAVLSLESNTDRIRLANDIAAGGLSVREAERRARSGSGPGRSPGGKVRTTPEDPVARRTETALARYFGTAVKVRLRGKAAGEIRIPFHDAEDFERIIRRLLEARESKELFEDG